MAKRIRSGRSGGWVFVPFVLFLILVAAYTLYWFIARGLLDQGIDDWMAAERANGKQISYSARQLDGFPFRFVLTLEDPVYGDPASGTWQGEQLQLVMQPWNWQHVIARSPGQNRFTPTATLGGIIDFQVGSKSVASLSWDETQIRRLSIVFDTLQIREDDEPIGDIDQFAFHLRPPPGLQSMLQLETHWQQISLANLPQEVGALGSDIGPSILRAELENGMAALASANNVADAISTALDTDGALLVPQIMLNWGPANLGAKGDLRRVNGDLRGSLQIRIEGADQLRQALSNTGQLDENTALAIDALEAASADGGFLPLTLQGDGVYFLGQNIAPIDLEGAL